MRLLNTASLELEEFRDTQQVSYTILSHCWSQEQDRAKKEVTYQEFVSGAFDRDGRGWRKIRKCCDLSRARGHKWTWIDTCCINKESSAELTEAINSMFRWYQDAAECYASIDDYAEADLPTIDQFGRGERWKKGLDSKTIGKVNAFVNSQWFKRGWTLQELLAPPHVIFIDDHNQILGTKLTLAPIISHATGIDAVYLEDSSFIRKADIGERMSWAATRVTTRHEDLAYSLLGIFDVRMPIYYGEGHKAFFRLEQEIIAQLPKNLTLAWKQEAWIQESTRATILQDAQTGRHGAVLADMVQLKERDSFIVEHEHTGEVYDEVRALFASTFEHFPYGQSLEIDLDWNVMDYMAQQFDLNEQGSTLFSQSIVYCGTATTAYATTALEYAERIWPKVGASTVDCIERACARSNHHAMADLGAITLQVQLDGHNTRIRLIPKARKFGVSGDQTASVQISKIAQVCTWLCVACRDHGDDSRVQVGLCEPQPLRLVDRRNGAWFVSVRASLTALSRHTGATAGSCWFGMVRNPVIAHGYPIPRRDESAQQLGLETSLDLMVTLSHADWSTTFGATYLLKGIISALVPVACGSTWIVWHFLINEDHTRMTYTEACAVANDSAPLEMDLGTVRESRHFVGVWTSHASIRAGSGDTTLYSDHLGPSETSEDARGLIFSLTNVAIGGGKYLTAMLNIAVGRKDKAPALAWSQSQAFQLHVRNTSAYNVILYGSADRRAWLLDGASTLLHLVRAWVASSSNSRYIDKGALEQIKAPTLSGGKDKAIDTLMANKPIVFWSDSKQEIASSEAGVSNLESASKLLEAERKTTVLGWTYEHLVTEFCQVLQAIHDKLHQLDCHGPEYDMKTGTRPTKALLSGFQATDLITQGGPFRPRVVQVGDHAVNWVKFAIENCFIVLLANTFGELICPQALNPECIGHNSMQSGQDFLAVPLFVLKDLAAQRRQQNSANGLLGYVQLTDKTWWHDFHAPCNNHLHCQAPSRLGRKADYHRRTHACFGVLSSSYVFDEYPEGAAVIGGGTNKLLKDNTPAKGKSRISSWFREKRDALARNDKGKARLEEDCTDADSAMSTTLRHPDLSSTQSTTHDVETSFTSYSDQSMPGSSERPSRPYTPVPTSVAAPEFLSVPAPLPSRESPQPHSKSLRHKSGSVGTLKALLG